METKKCTKCGIDKPFSEFYKQATGKNGLVSSCSTCVKAHVKKHREAKPEL